VINCIIYFILWSSITGIKDKRCVEDSNRVPWVARSWQNGLAQVILAFNMPQNLQNYSVPLFYVHDFTSGVFFFLHTPSLCCLHSSTCNSGRQILNQLMVLSIYGMQQAFHQAWMGIQSMQCNPHCATVKSPPHAVVPHPGCKIFHSSFYDR
jgi:hypothetical protein